MIQIEFYKKKHESNVIALICKEYGYDKNQYAIFFESFYSKFQEKAIMIVALDGQKVVGFQSFFFWPYMHKNQHFNSYQSGNSIVDSNYRGKGIFKKMLHYIDDKNLEIDFIVGFPVEASYNSFIKSDWKNPFNLNWYVRKMNILSILIPANTSLLTKKFETTQRSDINNNSNLIRLTDSANFINWRESYYKFNHYYYTFSKEDKICQFGFKLNIRKRILKEVIIGQINGNIDNSSFLTEAIDTFIKELKKIKFITFLSIAINPDNELLKRAIEKSNFKLSNRSIYFILKEGKTKVHQLQMSDWILLRGDIDTW